MGRARRAPGGLNAAPRQVETVVEQLDAWLESDWYRTFAAGGPEAPSGRTPPTGPGGGPAQGRSTTS